MGGKSLATPRRPRRFAATATSRGRGPLAGRRGRTRARVAGGSLRAGLRRVACLTPAHPLSDIRVISGSNFFFFARAQNARRRGGQGDARRPRRRDNGENEFGFRTRIGTSRAISRLTGSSCYSSGVGARISNERDDGFGSSKSSAGQSGDGCGDKAVKTW